MFSVACKHLALLSARAVSCGMGEVFALNMAAWCRQIVLAWMLMCRRTIWGLEIPARMRRSSGRCWRVWSRMLSR